MFTPNHFIWIGICAIIITGLLILSVKLKFTKKTAIMIMAVTSLVSELLKIFTHMELADQADPLKGSYIEAGALPLHLCSIFIFVFFYLVIDKDKHAELNNKIISFFVPIGLVGAFLAIMMATSGVNFMKPYAYQCFIYHAVMMYLALYFIITKQVDLGLKAYKRNLIILFALAIVMIWVNGALRNFEVNFFFVTRPPADGLPILNLNHGWYAYFATLAACGLIIETLCSLPYIIKEKKNQKN